MRLSRILGIVNRVAVCFVIALVIFGGYIVIRQEKQRWTSAFTSAYNPSFSTEKDKHFQLGDITAVRYGPGQSGTYTYSFIKGQNNIDLASHEGEFKRWHTSMLLSINKKLIDSDFEFYPPMPSLPESLPGEAGDVLRRVRVLAADVLTVKDMPDELGGACDGLKEAAEGRFQLTSTMDSVEFNGGVTHYGNEEVFQLQDFCNLFDDRCIAYSPGSPIVELSARGNKVFTQDTAEAKVLWDITGAQLFREVMLTSICSEIPAEVKSRLKSAYGWWSSGKYKTAPKMKSDEADRYAAPWASLAAPPEGNKSGHIHYSMDEPLKVNGVEISPDGPMNEQYLKLVYNGKSLNWWYEEAVDDWQYIRRDLHVRMAENADYPLNKWISNIPQVKADMDMMKSFAEQLVSAKESEWPDAEWCTYLRRDMKMLLAGKYWATYPVDLHLEMKARETFKGNDSYLVCYVSFYNENGGGSYIEIKISPEGFIIYDPQNGCYLDVGESEELTQQPEDLAANKKLNIAGAKMLVGYAQLIKDDLTPEIVEALAIPVEYFSKNVFPAPTQGEVSPPAWSYQAVAIQIQKTIDSEKARGWKPYY